MLHTDIIHHYPSSLLFQQEFLSQEGCAPRHGKSQLHGVCAENLPLVPPEPAQAACQGQDLLARLEVSPVLSLCQDSSSGGALTAVSCSSGEEPGRVGPAQGFGHWALGTLWGQRGAGGAGWDPWGRVAAIFPEEGKERGWRLIKLLNWIHLQGVFAGSY